jgi:hypothetical protein
MMLAVGVVALAPLLIRLAFFGCIALVIAIVAGVVIWSLWANPGHALALALTFGWIRASRWSISASIVSWFGCGMIRSASATLPTGSKPISTMPAIICRAASRGCCRRPNSRHQSQRMGVVAWKRRTAMRRLIPTLAVAATLAATPVSAEEKPKTLVGMGAISYDAFNDLMAQKDPTEVENNRNHRFRLGARIHVDS